MNANRINLYNQQNPTVSQSQVIQEKINLGRMQITDDLNQLLGILPSEIRQTVETHPLKDTLIEVVLDLGRLPEARFLQKAEYVSDRPVSKEDIKHCVERVGHFGGDNRAGIEKTLHRISAIRNRQQEIIGLTCRVGRAVFGTINMIRDLVETGQSILMLGRPGVGKTTALREIARILADDLHKRVVIIDSSNEIAGDGDIPHPAIGRARRMQVASPELQHQVMIEAVENHTPEVIVIDEIGTELEALAARTIAERGVQLIGTAHGNQIENLMKNPTLADLVGGIQAVTLGDEEARRRGSQKTVLERKAPPTFAIAVEMLERHRWVVHESVSETVDNLLRSKPPITQVRIVNDQGDLTITKETPPLPEQESQTSYQIQVQSKINGLRSSGKMSPLGQSNTTLTSEQKTFEQMLNQSWEQTQMFGNIPTGPNGEDLPLHIYPYGVSRQQLEQVIDVLNLPILITKDMDGADVVLAVRTQVKNHPKLRTNAKSRQIPIHLIKANTMAHITRALRHLLHLDDSGILDDGELNLFTNHGDDDELEALEEARLAVEQIVIPKGQPVELLPRSTDIRKIQHELVERYHLKSASFGDEPNRRLRIYPA